MSKTHLTERTAYEKAVTTLITGLLYTDNAPGFAEHNYFCEPELDYELRGDLNSGYQVPKPSQVMAALRKVEQLYAQKRTADYAVARDALRSI